MLKLRDTDVHVTKVNRNYTAWGTCGHPQFNESSENVASSFNKYALRSENLFVGHESRSCRTFGSKDHPSPSPRRWISEDLQAAPGQSNPSTEELPNHFMAYSKHRRKIRKILSSRNTSREVNE